MHPAKLYRRPTGARPRHAGAVRLLAPLLALILTTGCLPWMNRTEMKIDQIGKNTVVLQERQDLIAGEVARIRTLLESEGLVDDEQRAELLTRLGALERAVEQMSARAQEQENMLRRMSAALDQLTRQSWQSPGLPGGEAYFADSTKIGGQTPDTSAAEGPSPGNAAALVEDPSGGEFLVRPDSSGIEASLGAAESMTAGGDGSTELVIYDAAMGDFGRGNYALARDGFVELRTRFPRSQLVDDSAYWLAETLYAEERYEEALAGYQDLIRNYPDSEILPAALLKTGYCQLELGNSDAAVAVMKRLVRQYPESDEAEIAEHKLSRMGISP